jgi:protein-disulfide isomerase
MANKENKIKQREARRKQKQRDRVMRTAGFAVGALVLIAAIIFWPRQPVPEVAESRLNDQPFLGAAEAQVVMTEFGDFACSACRSWHQTGVLFQILQQFEGLVRYEWRDFPVITSDSPKAAEGGQCAHDQGKFWEYLDHVYNQPGSSYTNVREDDVRRYAAEIGLDTQAFNNCLDTNQHRATVSFDLNFANSIGMRGTPSFSVNGTPIIGANPDLLIQAIRAELQ